ncbi:unnamed protein product, partial [Adineta steineri]
EGVPTVPRRVPNGTQRALSNDIVRC